MRANKLRIGLILDELLVAAWEHRLISVIKAGDYAEISLVVLTDSSPQGKAPPALSPIAPPMGGSNVPNRLIDKALNALERFLVGKPGELANAFEYMDASALVADARILKIRPATQHSSDYIEGDDLANIHACNIDVLVQLGSRTFRGGILRAARCGLWSLRTGNDPDDCSGKAGYTEVMESSPETRSMLQMRTDDTSDVQVLYGSCSSTNVASLADNASRVLWKTLHFIPRVLKELHDCGEAAFLAKVKERNSCPRFYDRRNNKPPTNGDRMVLVWRKLREKVARKWNAWFYFDQWFLLFDIHDDISTHLSRFRYLLPPKDRFWADPFVVARDGKFYVFFEELLYTENKGHISVLVIDKDGAIEPPISVLETPYHLSYPFIFEFENDLYMVPESKQNRTIELYKCTAFPLKWEFQKNLMEDCLATDATLVQRNGKWWMFVSQIETEGASTWDELFLYHSDNPLSSRWTPHPLNPVVSDVRSARPAGRLFERHGHLFRPSQNSSGHYGYGFNICEILKITETEYEERVIERVEPKWDRNIISTHTLNFASGLTIIDGQLRRRRYR